ncbi:MFS transporter [Halobellus sp. GM3]|uniref:MFS transporter n=1 Tax=Halobellus sp. GM3 TaxID=3458410 RepID=UPI00403DC86F
MSEHAPSPLGADAWLYGWALGYVAIGAASVLVPLYAIDLGAGAFVVSLIAATAAFAGVPGAILWGRLASRTRRRRPFVLVALGLSGCVFLSFPFLGSPVTVLAANAVLWFVVAAAAPVLNLIVVEGYAAEQWNRRFGLLNHYQGYGWLAGLVAGGVWSAIAGPRFGLPALVSKRLFFVGSAVVAFGGILAVIAWYPEPPTISEQRFQRLSRRIRSGNGGAMRGARAIPYGPARVYWALRDVGLGRGSLARLRTRFSESLVRYLLAATVFFTGFSVFFAPLPAYLVDVGYADDEVFALFIASSAASAVAYARVGALATDRDPFRLQVGALLFRAGVFPIVAVTGAAVAPPVGLLAVGALFLAIGVSWAVIAVTATGIVTRLSPAAVRSEALGAYTAITSLGGGVGSVLGGVLSDAVGYLPAFVVAGGCVVVAVLLAVDGLEEYASSPAGDAESS